MKRSLAYLLPLLFLPSCMLCIVETAICDNFNNNEIVYPARPCNAKEDIPSSQWALARSEVLEFANEAGELICYAPIKVTLGEYHPSLLIKQSLLWPLPFVDYDVILGDTHDKASRGTAVAYYPLMSIPRSVKDTWNHQDKPIALFAPKSKMAKSNDFSPFLEGHAPASLRLIRKISDPNLKLRLYKHGFETLSSFPEKRGHNFMNRVGYWTCCGLVDIPLSITGTVVFSAYENTLGVPSCTYRNFFKEDEDKY